MDFYSKPDTEELGQGSGFINVQISPGYSHSFLSATGDRGTRAALTLVGGSGLMAGCSGFKSALK